jgi:hypothetical protein
VTPAADDAHLAAHDTAVADRDRDLRRRCVHSKDQHSRISI